MQVRFHRDIRPGLSRGLKLAGQRRANEETEWDKKRIRISAARRGPIEFKRLEKNDPTGLRLEPRLKPMRTRATTTVIRRLCFFSFALSCGSEPARGASLASPGAPRNLLGRALCRALFPVTIQGIAKISRAPELGSQSWSRHNNSSYEVVYGAANVASATAPIRSS